MFHVRAGYFALQANNKNVAMARATGPDLDTWVHKGVIGLPNESCTLSDVGRAVQLASGWYIPVGVGGPDGGGGIHWFRADDTGLSHITEASYLFNSSQGDPSFECPDVFQLGGKAVVLASEPGAVNTEGTSHWWVGSLSSNDLRFNPVTTGRFDYGLPGYSSTCKPQGPWSSLRAPTPSPPSCACAPHAVLYWNCCAVDAVVVHGTVNVYSSCGGLRSA